MFNSHEQKSSPYDFDRVDAMGTPRTEGYRGEISLPGTYVLRVEATRTNNQCAFREVPFEVSNTAPWATSD
jgi:hypothetical protein